VSNLPENFEEYCAHLDHMLDAYSLKDFPDCIYCCCEEDDLNDCVCLYNHLSDLYSGDGTLLVTVEPEASTPPIFDEQIGNAQNETPDLRERTSTKSKSYTHSEKFSNVFDHVQTDSSEQAIDFLVQDVGSNCNRTVSKLRTPSGLQDCIHMTNEGSLNSMRHDYLASVQLPEIGFVWGTSNLSKRTKYIMELFQYYSTMYIFKIIAKPSLFAAQRVWVGLGDAANQTDVGFEWNPSEQNEVYCVAPWVQPEFVAPVEDADQHIPTITITDLTDPIYADGVSTTIDYNVYIAPLNMTLYNPVITPVCEPVPLPTDTLSLTTVAVENLDAELANPYFVLIPRISVIQDGAPASLRLLPDNVEILSVDNIADTIDTNVVASNFASSLEVTNVLADDYDIVRISNYNGPIQLNSSLLADLDGNNNVNVNVPANSIVTVNSSSIDTVSPIVVINPLTEAIQVNNTGCIFAAASNNITLSASAPASVFVHTISRANFYSNFGFDEQISEYKYNPDFKVDSRVYGKTGNHTSRCDTHWDAQQTAYFNTVDDVKYVTNTRKGTAHLDAARHYFLSKHPVMKLTSTSVPSANVKFRVTQIQPGTTPTLEQVLELPGVEWDPKTGPLTLQPYWRSKHPVRTTAGLSDFLFQINILGGTIASEPVAVTAFANYTCVDYHYPFLNAASVTRRPQFDEQIETVTNDSNTEQEVDSASSDSINGNVKISTPTIVVEEDSLKQYSPGNIAQTWRNVTKFQITATQTAIAIPINNRTLGAPAFQESQRYTFWRGNPKFKFVVSVPRNYNGLFYVTQVPASMDVNTLKASQIVQDREVSTFTAIDGSLEFQSQWGTVMPRLRTIVDVNDNANTQDTTLGYIVIYADQLANNTTANVSLFVDAADVEFLSEVGRDVDVVWSPPAIISPPAFKNETWLDFVDMESAMEVLKDSSHSRLAEMTFEDIIAHVRRRLAHHGLNVGDVQTSSLR
jgi:hypothetical protein